MLTPKDLALRYGKPIRPAVNPMTDIPIPDDVYAEEQYEDMLKIVDYILPLLEPYDFNNSTSEGRLRGELSWLKQEIKAKRFPIPGVRSMLATTSDLGKNYYLPTDMTNVQPQLKSLISLVQCNGFVKPRHYPRIIEFIDGFIVCIRGLFENDFSLTEIEKHNLHNLKGELIKMGKFLYNNKDIFPLSKDEWPAYRDMNSRGDIWSKHEQFEYFEHNLTGPLMSCWRPRQSQPSPGWIMPDWVKEPLDNPVD